jgi:copper chaperone
MSGQTTERFGIEGMHCNGCVKSVTRAVTALPGVSRAEVSLEGRCAEVAFDAASVAPEAIVAAIEAAGFDARRL